MTTHAVAEVRLFTVAPEAYAFLRLLADVVARHALELHAYCLMSTHVHLLLGDPETEISPAMRELNGRYARWVNRRRHRRGALFEGRFRPIAIESDGHLLELIRYIALGDSISNAKLNAYTAVKQIRWDGAWCRKDISDKALLV